MLTRRQQKVKQCDVCIIGAGPAGLAALSAIHEPYTVDTMTPTQISNANLSMKKKRNGSKKKKQDGTANNSVGVGPSDKKICVIDRHDDWLGVWNDNFSR